MNEGLFLKFFILMNFTPSQAPSKIFKWKILKLTRMISFHQWPPNFPPRLFLIWSPISEKVYHVGVQLQNPWGPWSHSWNSVFFSVVDNDKAILKFSSTPSSHLGSDFQKGISCWVWPPKNFDLQQPPKDNSFEVYHDVPHSKAQFKCCLAVLLQT